MKILISGICGFAGSTIALRLKEELSGAQVSGFDNFSRSGSALNRPVLERHGIRVRHADARSASDLEALPRADWVIDAAANPSVLAGLTAAGGSRQLVDNNLLGTVNLLEYCKTHQAGFILLSTSRVYSIRPLAELKLKAVDQAFRPDPKAKLPRGITKRGVSEEFATAAPISLYGATKLASEALALEYGAAFGFPVWINRCGVLAGAGQFGRADQGIFSFWINSWLRRRPLEYLGFGGRGFQVRDCLHPADLVGLLLQQMQANPKAGRPPVVNLGGGPQNAMSLAQLSEWCAARFGAQRVTGKNAVRRYDVAWMVMDSALAAKAWGWRPETKLESILDEIARHAESHPEWLEVSTG